MSGAGVPKWLANAAGSITWISPRGVVTVIPVEVASSSRSPAKADRKMWWSVGFFGDQHRPGDSAHRVGMLLERWVPEILRVVLPAGEETNLRRHGVARECERETDLDGAAVGPPPSRSKPTGRKPRSPPPRRPPHRHPRRAFQHHHGQSLVARQERLVDAPEQHREIVAAELVGFRDRQHFDEVAGELDDVVVGPPGVAVARADGEAHAAIEGRSGVEVAHGMDDMVEAAGHGLRLLSTSGGDDEGADTTVDGAISELTRYRLRGVIGRFLQA